MEKKAILRLVDGLHRNKDIDSEIIFQALERALETAVRKKTDKKLGDINVSIDRDTGEVEAHIGEEKINPEELGRIAAQTAKQVMLQRIKEAEGEIIYQEYTRQKGSLVSGMVKRFEGASLVVNLEKTEAVLPKSEQIPREHYQPGERLRAIILDVQRMGSAASVILSRSHPDFVKSLFKIEVPEVGEGVVMIRGIAREPGERTKIAMESLEPHVDCIGACVGVRGTRIRSIIDELNGEKIDIIPWRDAPEMLIADSLKPAEILQMTLEEDEHSRHATVIVPKEELALAIGKKGQNVRLAVKLTGWNIDIQPPESLEDNKNAGSHEEDGSEGDEPGLAAGNEEKGEGAGNMVAGRESDET